MEGIKIPPRQWRIGDLLDLGNKSGVTYLKAVPVLILTDWVMGHREEGAANFAETAELARRIVEAGLREEFPPKGTSNVIGALRTIQKSRNLTRPVLLGDPVRRGLFPVTLPYYEALLQEYREKYREQYPEDYEKLFSEGEPDWGVPTEQENTARPQEAEVMLPISFYRDAVNELMPTITKGLDVASALAKENRSLKERIDALQEEKEAMRTQKIRFVHTSPIFAGSVYESTITSIKDTVIGMIQRAEKSIRISTLRIEILADHLIAAKLKDSELQITVFTRDDLKGERYAIGKRTLSRMRKAGIEVIAEKELLHSRVVAIDDQEVLISSADLDHAQMEHEFNAGVWTNDSKVVNEAIHFIDNLIGFRRSS